MENMPTFKNKELLYQLEDFTFKGIILNDDISSTRYPNTFEMRVSIDDYKKLRLLNPSNDVDLHYNDNDLSMGLGFYLRKFDINKSNLFFSKI